MITTAPVPEPIEFAEPSANDNEPLGVRLIEPTRFDWLRAMKVDTQIGPIWLGTFGLLSVLFFAAGTFVVLASAFDQVNGSPLLLVKYFANLNLAPPDGLAPARSLRAGGYWQIATLLWALSTIMWAGRCWERLVRHRWRPFLLFAWLSAIFSDGVHLGLPPAHRRIVGRCAGARTQQRLAVGPKLFRAVGQSVLQPVPPARDLLLIRAARCCGGCTARRSSRPAPRAAITRMPRSRT